MAEEEVVVSSTVCEDGEPMYMKCNDCNYGTHICHGCGADLTHSGHERIRGEWVKHDTSCVD